MSGDMNKGVAASVRRRLLEIARQRGEDYNLVLTRYAMERFLYRLSCSKYRTNFILKGAMLFQLWNHEPYRATRDLDLLAFGEVTPSSVQVKLISICKIEDSDDGLVFDVTSLTTINIREDKRYGGVRAKFTARLGSARILVQIDIGVGDIITPPAVESTYPTLLGMEQPIILAYPRETVVAEKLEAIVSLGIDNSRMKDYFDLWFIITTFDNNPETLALALARTFSRRRQTLPQETPIGLSDRFASDESKRAQWNAFTERSGVASNSLELTVSVVREFAMPLFASTILLVADP